MRFFLVLTAAAAASWRPSFAHPPVKEWKPKLGFNADAAQHIRIHAHTRWMWTSDEPVKACGDVTYSDVIPDAFFWPYSGLRNLQRRIHQAYTKDSGYERQYRAKTDQYSGSAADTIEANYTRLIQCAADSQDDILGGPLTALCTCAQRVEPTEACAYYGALAVNTICLDQMKAAAKFDVKETCADLNSENGFGVPLSSKCTGWVAGSVSALELSLHPANYPSGTPQAINAGVADKETRTYYLLHRALERFIRFTEHYDLCEDEAENDYLSKDFTPLPTWKLEKMWWLDNAKNNNVVKKSKLPLAALFSRSGCDTDGSCPDGDGLLLLVRDARNSYEALLQNTYEAGRQLEFHSGGAIVHAGYDMLGRQIAPGVLAFLAKWLAARPRTGAKVTYTGFGLLGSGVASVVAHAVAGAYQQTPQGVLIPHDLVAFESGRVGNYEFNKQLAHRVNVRNVGASSSILSEFPCESPRSCDRDQIVPTGDWNGVNIAQYLPLPGKVEPRAQLTDTTTENLVASALCTSNCWATTDACSDDAAHSWCSRNSGCLAISSNYPENL